MHCSLRINVIIKKMLLMIIGTLFYLSLGLGFEVWAGFLCWVLGQLWAMFLALVLWDTVRQNRELDVCHLRASLGTG